MRSVRAALLFTIVLAILPGVRAAKAEGNHRVPVQVSCSCEDPGGQAYLKAVREEIAHSSNFREVATNEELDGGAISINIVSSAIGNQTARTGLKVICSHNGEALLNQEVEICNRYPMKIFAQAMLDVLKSV